MGTVFRRDDSKKWWISYSVEGRRFREAVGTKAQAEALLRKREQAVFEGTHFPGIEKRALTVGQLCELWCTQWGRHKRSIAADRTRWRLLTRFLGESTKISTLRTEDVRRVIDRLRAEPRARGGGPRTPADVNRHLALLRAALKAAQVEGYQHASPTDGVKFLPGEKQRYRTVSLEEFEQLVEVLRSKAASSSQVKRRPVYVSLEVIVTLAYYSGMRLGEICDLRWSCIDLQRKIAHIPVTKNGQARDVGLHPKAIELLACLPRTTGDRVFSDATCSANISSQFSRLCRKIGLRDLRIHDLRHSAATAMARGGVPWTVIMRQGGWKSTQVASRYQNPDGEDLVQAVAQMVPRVKSCK